MKNSISAQLLSIKNNRLLYEKFGQMTWVDVTFEIRRGGFRKSSRLLFFTPLQGYHSCKVIRDPRNLLVRKKVPKISRTTTRRRKGNHEFFQNKIVHNMNQTSIHSVVWLIPLTNWPLVAKNFSTFSFNLHFCSESESESFHHKSFHNRT